MARKEKQKVNDLKIASGGENISYAVLPQETTALGKENDNPTNIIDFPKELTKKVEFQINDSREHHDDFMRLLFVSKVIDKDESIRIFKTLIHVEVEDDKRIVIATDGNRLHAAVVDLDLLPGNYTIRVTKKLIALQGPVEEAIKYPDWRKITPENTDDIATIDFANTDLGRDKSKLARMSHKMYSLIKKTNKLINLYYLNDLSKEPWVISLAPPGRPNAPVVFRRDSDKKMFALIMPMEPEN
jgi:DNA polymerase III sliding clamp (beta) subunit (PCNA family)